uniref:Si:ch211-81a5.5 n=1 Tax=Salarias fasciatus TaxID=181472 RepID=A0A672FK48_SALFA
MSRKRQNKEKANAEEEALKNTDEYRCSGNVEEDFPALCALLCIKDVPAVSVKQPASAEGVEKDTGKTDPPRVEVMLENEGPLSAKRIKISGWKVNEQIFQVLLKMLPSVSQLCHCFVSCLFWQAGLTDPMVIALMNAVSLCSSLRVVMLEGNTLPEQSYHHLLSEDSPLAHLSLRNNRIGDEGARLIGSALSTATSTNKNLLSLSLAFNSIADEGASHIAQGLRLNRTLCFLSLSNNQIGDSGAARLAEVLGEFALTHEEVVERRKLLLQRTQSVSGRKPSFSVGSDIPPSEQTEVDTVNPLLDPSLYHRDGQLFLPGNSTLTSLNLAGQTPLLSQLTRSNRSIPTTQVTILNILHILFNLSLTYYVVFFFLKKRSHAFKPILQTKTQFRSLHIRNLRNVQAQTFA